MVHATTMTLVMAEKDEPVFRDFLGLAHRDEAIQPEHKSSDVARPSRSSARFDSEADLETSATRASSGTSGRFETCSAPGFLSAPFGIALPSSSDPGSVGWQLGKAGALQHHGIRSAFYKPDLDNVRVAKKRDSPGGRESLQERLQMSVEAIENSRPLKVTRFEQQRFHRRVDSGDAAPSLDDLRLSMQPPRPSSNGLPWLQQTCKPELSNRNPKKVEGHMPLHCNTGLAMPRLSHLGACAERTERLSVVASRENTMATPPLIARPAADEGSRTGLTGSPLVALLNSTAAPTPGGSSCPPLTPRRPKISAHSAGSDSMLPSCRQGTAPASRQLTIFYGGQAHVFDDVPPDKADAIMALAGSNGRSWSTTYSPRPTASVPNSASEGSLSALEREREKTVQSRGASVNGGGSLALSSEVQTLLRGLAQSGIGTGRPM